MTCALLVGRFQPFHLGHLELARRILADNDEIVIAVASSQFNYIAQDPFTAGERLEMIRNSLRDDGIDMSRCFIASIENRPNTATWVSYVQSMLPQFDSVYTGNRYVAMLFEASSIRVHSPTLVHRDTYASTHIRRLMVEGGDWQSCLPAAAVKIIQRIDGVKRMNVISNSDTNPSEH